MERYLRTFAAGNERHWDRLLALAKCSYNAHVHKAANLPSFEADPGENSRMPLDVITAASQRLGSEALAVSFATSMNDILHQLTESLKVPQLAVTTEATQERQPPQPQPGDARHFPLGHSSAGAADAGGVTERAAEEGGARLSRAF